MDKNLQYPISFLCKPNEFSLLHKSVFTSKDISIITTQTLNKITCTEEQFLYQIHHVNCKMYYTEK